MKNSWQGNLAERLKFEPDYWRGRERTGGITDDLQSRLENRAMHEQRTTRKRRIKAAKDIMTQMVAICRRMITEVRDMGKVSRTSERKLRRLSDAGRKLYPSKIVLMSMERAFKAGYREASTDALLFSYKEGVEVPRWALKSWAESQRSGPNEKGGRPVRHPWVVLWRVWAVERSTRQDKYERDRRGDRYERARQLLETMNPRLFAGLPVLATAEAIKKSYRDFRRSGRLGYLSPKFFEGLLQGMVLASMNDKLRRRN